MTKQTQPHQRLEQAVRDKLDKGWNAFTREEVEGLLEMLYASRRAKQALYQRIHTAHGDAVGWHLDGDIGLHERRPAPEGARNLFEKPKRLDFVRGWRVPTHIRINGFKVTDDGRLVQMRHRTPVSPNDLMRSLQYTLQNLSYAYKVFQNDQSSAAGNSDSIGQVAESADLPAGSGGPVADPVVSEQPGTDREDLPGDGEA